MPLRAPRPAFTLTLAAVVSTLMTGSAGAITLADVIRQSREGVSADELLAELRATDPPLTPTEGELELLEASQVSPRVIAFLRGETDAPPEPAPALAPDSTPASDAGHDIAPGVRHRAGTPVSRPSGPGGWVLGAGLGGNLCFADFGGSCDGLHAGLTLDALFGYRFPWLTLSIDVQAGTLYGAGDEETADSYTDHSVMPTVRLNLRTGGFELQLGGGVGYVAEYSHGLRRLASGSVYGWRMTESDGEWRGFVGGKVLVGAFAADVYPRLDIGVVGTLLLRPNEGQTCYTPASVLEDLSKSCDSVEEAPINERVTVSLQLIYRFPN